MCSPLRCASTKQSAFHLLITVVDLSLCTKCSGVHHFSSFQRPGQPGARKLSAPCLITTFK
ncbi:hypothetical protein PR001_g9897 [Phytophthora rubi]|uniref:Arf-GAP domain-containing protein n=1 Tax=Phytophthora rubi TaxID=129364 RepID=A0A6A3MXC8_9STRA|nr:hypothetical protein PR001_g9897 [Phytophthora rubi]